MDLAHVIKIIAGLIYGFILVTPKLVFGITKSILVALLLILLFLIYLMTYAVPNVGKRTRGLKELLRTNILASYFAVQAHRMRRVLVQIVAEEDNLNPEFQDPEKYRSRLKQVRKDAKNRLEQGETFLSILLGIFLVGAQFANVDLLEATIYGISANLLIEGWLLAIAISIIYRTSALEILAYNSDEEFESLAEMDAALGYQKGVSLVGFFQGLMFLLVFVAAISRVKYDLIEEALRARYSNDPWLAFTWKKLREQQ